MRKHDYSIFTKQELVDFIQKHESNFRFIDTPYDLMIDKKMDNITKSLDKNLKYGKKLRADYEKITEKDNEDIVKYLIESKKNHDKWQELDKEYDRLSKLRFGE